MATVRYIVSSVETAITFYTKHLGFTLHDQMGTAFAMVTKGDLTLWLSGPQSSAARSMPDGRTPNAGGWNRFVVTVENIEVLVASMKAAGVQFRNEVITGPGGKQVLAEDPSGNPIELFEPA